jgi:hypothetical protein
MSGFNYLCVANQASFKNFAFQIEMTIVKGDGGGLLFCLNENASQQYTQFYYFRLSTTGDYGLFAYTAPGRFNDAKKILGGNTKLAKGIGQANTVTVIVQGSQIALYLNQQYLESTTDSSFSSGIIGVFASDLNQPTDVAFQNVKVWQL